MQKIIVGIILPIAIILCVSGYFTYLFYFKQVQNSSISAKWEILLENWYLALMAILAYIFMRHVDPKIFKA